MTSISDDYKKIKEVEILDRLNKKLNILDKSQYNKPNYKGLNTSSIKLDSEICNNTTDNVI